MTRYTITQAIVDVAEVLHGHSDQSSTTIRCAINDALNHASRSGLQVNHDYDQPCAVARVRRLLNQPAPARSAKYQPARAAATPESDGDM